MDNTPLIVVVFICTMVIMLGMLDLKHQIKYTNTHLETISTILTEECTNEP
jgi:hypothetical protein